MDGNAPRLEDILRTYHPWGTEVERRVACRNRGTLTFDGVGFVVQVGIVSSDGITKWWWVCVPYVFLFSAVVILLKPTPGILAHILWPLLVLFWIALPASMVWTVAKVTSLILRRQLARWNVATLIAATASSLLGIYLQFFWAGNLR
jgi:hypothetical protein